MVIRSDPENNEIRALFDLADLDGKEILEIGCGDGRLTRQYAEIAGHVTAIDPYEKFILRAKENQPARLVDRVAYHPVSIEGYAAKTGTAAYDTVILSWAL